MWYNSEKRLLFPPVSLPCFTSCLSCAADGVRVTVLIRLCFFGRASSIGRKLSWTRDKRALVTLLGQTLHLCLSVCVRVLDSRDLFQHSSQVCMHTSSACFFLCIIRRVCIAIYTCGECGCVRSLRRVNPPAQSVSPLYQESNWAALVLLSSGCKYLAFA